MFPSLAPKMHGVDVGDEPLTAADKGTAVFVDGVNYFVGQDSVAHISNTEPREVLDTYSQSPKYMALARGAMHYMMNDANVGSEMVIRHLVLGLPLNTHSKFHESLASRMLGEHLLPSTTDKNSRRRVTVERTSVVCQPRGALLNYGVAHNYSYGNKWVVVVDAGGGTLDWFVTYGNVPNWQRSGAHFKSMLACAYAVSDQINPEWRTKYTIIDRIDKALRDNAPSFSVAGRDYRISDYAKEITTVLDESAERMVARIGGFDEIDMVLFTGGGARVFHDYFCKRYPDFKNMMKMDMDSVYANVRGFHYAGEVACKKAK
jgi:plasmid segregation protein ParM